MESRELEQEFMRALHRLGRAHMKHAFQGVSRGEFAILISLEHYEERHAGEGIKASVLAELVDSSPQALSRTLRGLEAKGYVERRVDRRDRRNACICLTEEARGVMEVGKRQMAGFFDQVVEAMGEEEICELISRLNRLADVMHEIGEADSDCENSRRARPDRREENTDNHRERR